MKVERACELGTLELHLKRHCVGISCADHGAEAGLERFPLWMNRMGFANQLVSDSNYLPMEVGRYVKGPFC